ncbi:MAG TPA: hypothetical protein VGE97_03490 [Nitrososphaera sp.]|jgi:hypothetical protein
MSSNPSTSNLIPPKKQEEQKEPELKLPETKTDVTDPGKSIDLSKDAWEIFNIDNLPVLTEQQVERFEKHLADKKEVWKRANIKTKSFPIRCRVLKNKFEDSPDWEPEFETVEIKDEKTGEMTEEPRIVVKNFKYTPISLYEREKIVMMTSEVADLQRLAQALAIVKSIERGEKFGQPNVDIKIDFESLPEILRHEDFTKIQSKLMKKQLDLNHYQCKAYLNMSPTSSVVAHWSDVRDWLDVARYQEQHVLGEWSGVM